MVNKKHNTIDLDIASHEIVEKIEKKSADLDSEGHKAIQKMVKPKEPALLDPDEAVHEQ